MTSKFPFAEFIGLHRKLLSRMLFLDSFLGVSGAAFLITPLDKYALSLENVSLLVLFVFSTVVYQIHLFRTYAGGATFYLNLPAEKHQLLKILYLDAIIPLLIALSISEVVVVLAHVLRMTHFTTQMMIAKKAYYMMLILFMIKTVALPVLILYKRHIALILVFLGSLVLVYEVISIAAEFMHISNVAFGLIFLTGVEAICIKILMSARIS